MAFSLSNIWLGNEASLQPIMALNSFLQNPTQDIKAFSGYDDDDEDDEPRFEGIGAHLIQIEGSVGVIRINGSLTNRYSWWNSWFGVISYDEIRDALISLANDEEISSILLEIDTGGGAAHGVDEVAELIRSIDTKIKPIEAHTSMYVFSAGMWIASAARKLTANPISEQGSIGVIITLTSYHELYKKAGVDVKYVRAGKYKALGQIGEELSDKVIAMAEEKADKLYGYFLDAMIRGRPNLSIANKDAWAEGKTFFSDQAIGLGLIDEISSFDKVIANLSSNYDNSANQAQFANAEAQPNLQGSDTDMTKKTTGKKAVLDEAALAAAASGAIVAAEEVEEEEGAETPTEEENTEGTEGGEDESGEGSEEASSTPVGDASMSSMLSELRAELKDTVKLNAKLEVKVEALTEELASAKLSSSNVEAALKPIAIQAINRLQVALGQTPTDIGSLSASAIADMFASVDKTFNEAFSIGGPKSRAMASAREEADNVSTEFCTIRKPSK